MSFSNMNGTDTINLNNARLLTILNAGREQLDRLQTDVNIKSQLVDELCSYPDQLESQVKEKIQIDIDEVKEQANEMMQEIVKSVMDRSEQQIQEKLRQKTELHALDTERQIQADLLERAQQKHEKCVQKLAAILRDGEEQYRKLATDLGWTDEMSVE